MFFSLAQGQNNTIDNNEFSLEVEGDAINSEKDNIAIFGLENDSDSHLIIRNSTFSNNYFVTAIEGTTAMPRQPGLVLRGIGFESNDNSNDALLHITPYIINGSLLEYPTQRHYLGIQGFSTTGGTLSLLEIDENGYVGIGQENPRSKLEVADGDIYLSDINHGVIMKSPNGQCWRGTLDNSGQLNFVSITCP